ncbi:hypothetical protein SO694_00082048 [Aureococcus anophagefferens]|uniref:MYND-type domain-containing protein n=1 Tax=Aureococcus anophagefferens TaxID=44056 RepID=A0ABR1FJ41_AURAN
MGDWRDKRDEYQALKSRRKARQALKACGICGEPSTFNCVCGTIAYCSQACKTVDWRDRGHREACERIRDADAAAPSPPPAAVVYGPAPRSDADEARAIAQGAREAAAAAPGEPAPEPLSPRYGSRCPICREAWDVNVGSSFRVCCAMNVCVACAPPHLATARARSAARAAAPEAFLAALRRRAGEGSAAALYQLGQVHRAGALGLARDAPSKGRRALRASDLGEVEATVALAYALHVGDGVARDDERALELCRAAADWGHAGAVRLRHDALAPAKFEAAFAYYVHSAHQGFTLAEFYVGRYLHLGLAVDRDLGGEAMLATARPARREAARGAANAHAGDMEELWDLHAHDLEELEDSHATDLADAVRATLELKDSHAREIADAVEVRHADPRGGPRPRARARAR